MATEVITDGFISVAGQDLSDRARQITVNFTADTPEDTAMGDTYRSRLVGLKDVTVTVEWLQDYGASNVDATLWAEFDSSSTTAIVIRHDSGSASSTNPQYSGNVIVSDYTPVSGSVGDVISFSTSWEGSGAWTRATS